MNEKYIEVKIDAETLRVLKSAAWLWSQEPVMSSVDCHRLKEACRRANDILMDSGAKV